MPRLMPCPSCHSHVLADDRECPHCGAALRGNRAAAAVLMGLALTGCPRAEPDYGVPSTETTDGSGTATETMTNTGMESEYGVPGTGEEEAEAGATSTDTGTDTDSGGEPEYGVPTT